MTRNDEVVGQATKQYAPTALVAVCAALVTALGIRVVGPRQSQDQTDRHLLRIEARIDSILIRQTRMDSTTRMAQDRLVSLVAGTVYVACTMHPKESYLAGLPCYADGSGPRLTPQLPGYRGER
jgi:hypothetical protein